MKNHYPRRSPSTLLTSIVSGLSAAIIITVSLALSHSQTETEDPLATLHASAEEADALITSPMDDREWQKYKEVRDSLLTQNITLRLPENISETEWIIRLFDHPDWIITERNDDEVNATVNKIPLKGFIEKEIIPHIPRAENIVIKSLPDEDETRAEIEGEMKDGWYLENEMAAEFVAQSIEGGIFDVTLPLIQEYGSIVNEAEEDLGEFQLLSRGRSNFSGSIPNRIFNVKKTVNEHLNGVLIAPGETFSFIKTLDGPVETYTGWKEAVGIFNGNELNPTAGGGICQASTTVYRAALLAGLPMEEHRNHSIYIKYYKKYGEGLDATVYPGHQDLKFVNNTPGYLLMLTKIEDDDVVVEFYGTPDGRTISLEGPFRKRDKPKDLELDRPMYVNDIAWRRNISHPDGTTESETLLANYLDGIPWNTPASASIIIEETEESMTSSDCSNFPSH